MKPVTVAAAATLVLLAVACTAEDRARIARVLWPPKPPAAEPERTRASGPLPLPRIDGVKVPPKARPSPAALPTPAARAPAAASARRSALRPTGGSAPKRAKPRTDAGPDLPWPCWLVRMHANGKTEAELRRIGRERGVKLTRKQERQAVACLRGHE